MTFRPEQIQVTLVVQGSADLFQRSTPISMFKPKTNCLELYSCTHIKVYPGHEGCTQMRRTHQLDTAKEWLATKSPTPSPSHRWYQIRRYFTFHACIPGNHPNPSPLCVYPDRRKFKVRIVETTRVCVDKVYRGEVNVGRIR